MPLGRFDLVLAGRRVTLDGPVAMIDGDVIAMSARERAVFEALARRPGAVIPKGRLALQIWGSATSTRAVDTTVSRLRRRLGVAGAAVRTTRNRGYWLDAAPVNVTATKAPGSEIPGPLPSGSGT
jgi:DNA-binding response OmpR family regulator